MATLAPTSVSVESGALSTCATPAAEEGGHRCLHQSWRRRIADFVLNGKIASAENELRAFGKRYPDLDDKAQPVPRIP